MEQKKNNPLLPILAGAAIGALAVDFWQDHVDAEDRKSSAEIEDPETVIEVLDDLETLFDCLSLPEGLQDENQYRDFLSHYLDTSCEYQIEVEPSWYGMKPDILIHGLVAIELKVNPSKVEIDRLVGQVAGYARQWATMIFLIDTPPSKVLLLEQLLDECGLDHLELIVF